MSQNQANSVSEVQATLTETWNNRDPNTSPQTTAKPRTDDRNNTPSSPESPHPSHSSRSRKASDNTASPDSTGTELKPVSTWSHESKTSETFTTLFTRAIAHTTETTIWRHNPEPTETLSDLFSRPLHTQTSKPQPEPDSVSEPEQTQSTQSSTESESTRSQSSSNATRTAKPESPATTKSPQPQGGVATRVRTKQPTENSSKTTQRKSPYRPETNSNKERDAAQNSDVTERTPTGNEIVAESCPECDGEIVHEHCDQYCSGCGLVVADQKIDPGPEWRSFNSEEQTSQSRVGSPVKNNIHDKGLSTVIGNGNKDAHGNPLSSRKRKQMKRLRRWDSRFKVKSTKERNLRQAFGEIQRISSEMDLPDYVEETACTIYRRALDEELLPGRSIESIASASVYIAMRQASIPKTLDHLLSYCRVEESRITGAYSYLGRELGIEIQPPEVLEYLNRVASELGVSTATERKAEELLQTSVEKKLHSGKAPSGMAAAAIYAATMVTRCDRITQQEACDAGDVCELTIRTRHRELLEAYGIDSEKISPPSKSKAEDRDEPVDELPADVFLGEVDADATGANATAEQAAD